MLHKHLHSRNISDEDCQSVLIVRFVCIFVKGHIQAEEHVNLQTIDHIIPVTCTDTVFLLSV